MPGALQRGDRALSERRRAARTGAGRSLEPIETTSKFCAVEGWGGGPRRSGSPPAKRRRGQPCIPPRTTRMALSAREPAVARRARRGPSPPTRGRWPGLAPALVGLPKLGEPPAPRSAARSAAARLRGCGQRWASPVAAHQQDGLGRGPFAPRPVRSACVALRTLPSFEAAQRRWPGWVGVEAADLMRARGVGPRAPLAQRAGCTRLPRSARSALPTALSRGRFRAPPGTSGTRSGARRSRSRGRRPRASRLRPGSCASPPRRARRA